MLLLLLLLLQGDLPAVVSGIFSLAIVSLILYLTDNLLCNPSSSSSDQ